MKNLVFLMMTILVVSMSFSIQAAEMGESETTCSMISGETSVYSVSDESVRESDSASSAVIN